MTPDVLVILNRASGTGHASGFASQIAKALREGHGTRLAINMELVNDHPHARLAAAEFASAERGPVLIVVAGGGGTLRAAVEGIMDVFPKAPPKASRVQLAGLRMGSGNVVARELAIPRDPLEAAREVGESLAARTTMPVGVLRCTHGTPDGGSVTRHAVTMCGMGAFGRVPGDIARHRASWSGTRKRMASLIGLEQVNLLEYLTFGSGRMLGGTLAATQCELVEIDRSRRLRLLAAVALNLPSPPLPHPGVSLGDAAAGLVVVPRLGRPFRRRLEPGNGFEMKLLDRDSVEFFLDEDPELMTEWLKLEVAGTIAFVPGRTA